MRKSRADFIIAFLTYSCDHSEMKKDPEERTYDVCSCFQAMRSFLEFGWTLAEFKGLDVKTCTELQNRLGFGMGAGPDGRPIYGMGLGVPKMEGLTALDVFRYIWMELHSFLFQKDIQERCVDLLFNMGMLPQWLSMWAVMLINTKTSVMIDRAFAFLANRIGTFNFYAKTSAEAIYYESMVLTMNCVFSGVSFRLVRSRHEWETMKQFLQPPSLSSQDHRWGLLMGYKPPTSEERNK